MNLTEYNNWLKSQKISKKQLAEKIQWRYDHVVTVLNGNAPLTNPLKGALELFKELKQGIDTKILWEIAYHFVKQQKKAYSEEPFEMPEIEWSDIEEEWFDYLNEKINHQE